MGEWRIVIEGGPSGHGCDRKKAEGEVLDSCGRSDCPDCYAVEILATLRLRGVPVKSATFTHWPGTPDEVVDEYLPGAARPSVVATRKRGNFLPKTKPAAPPEHLDDHPKS
jgi:hypothetical protein